MALVLIVANRTATTAALAEAVRNRAAHGDATFHLVVPAHPHGLHRVVDPQDADRGESEAARGAGGGGGGRGGGGPLRRRSGAAGAEVRGEVGAPEPLSAIQDAVNLR